MPRWSRSRRRSASAGTGCGPPATCSAVCSERAAGAAGRIGRAADRLTRNSDGERVDEAQGKIGRIDEQIVALESELAAAQTSIETKWATAAAAITTVPVSLERTDVKVSELVLAWIPVP